MELSKNIISLSEDVIYFAGFLSNEERVYNFKSIITNKIQDIYNLLNSNSLSNEEFYNSIRSLFCVIFSDEDLLKVVGMKNNTKYDDFRQLYTTMTLDKILQDEDSIDNDSWEEECEIVYTAAVTKNIKDKYKRDYVFTPIELKELIEEKEIALTDVKAYGLITSSKSSGKNFKHDKYVPIKFDHLVNEEFMRKDDYFDERISLIREMEINKELKEIVEDIKKDIIDIFNFTDIKYKERSEDEYNVANTCYKWLNDNTNKKEYIKLIK